MPGMGLTAIGLAGVTISYAGIAHTFIDGMHAMTGLTMFIGLIFLAAGILDGGVSTSNRAKATTLVVISIALGFGMFAFTMNTIESTNIFAGLLLAIAFPAIVIAYVAAKMPKRLKPIGTIVALAGITGIVSFVAFGFVSPDTYIIAEEVTEEIGEEPKEPVSVIIPQGAGVRQDGQIYYDPEKLEVPLGTTVIWTNEDSAAHTVTSGNAQAGPTGVFDSGMFMQGDVYQYTFTTPGNQEYFCVVHPWMVGAVKVG